MIIISSIITTLNILFLIILAFVAKDERTKAGQIGFTAMILLFMANTVLIWY